MIRRCYWCHSRCWPWQVFADFGATVIHQWCWQAKRDADMEKREQMNRELESQREAAVRIMRNAGMFQ